MTRTYALAILTLWSALELRPAFAAESVQPPLGTPSSEDSNKKTRDFYEVLEDLMADFEYDLKNGDVKGLNDLSIRQVALSENIPGSFKSHMELLVTERILKNSKSNIIQCLPCRSKQATLKGDQIIVTSPDSNPAEMARIAKKSGIIHFMDMAFAYQPTGLMLSMYVTDADSGSVVWSRSYNSETSRAAAFRRGVDYSQVDDARRKESYEPTIMYKPTIYYLFEKNISSYTGAIGLGMRVVERYDNRKKEVGFELNYLIDSNTISNSSATEEEEESLYSGFNLTLLFVHAWNLIGDIENYNQVRGNVYVGLGGTYADGFLGGLIRTGYEWRLGKHWAFSTNIGYRPKSTAVLEDSSSVSISGLEFGIGISAMF